MKSVEYKAKNYTTFFMWVELSLKHSKVKIHAATRKPVETSYSPLWHDCCSCFINMWHSEERGIWVLFGLSNPKKRQISKLLSEAWDACRHSTEAEACWKKIHEIIDVNLWLLWSSFYSFLYSPSALSSRASDNVDLVMNENIVSKIRFVTLT